MVIGRKRKVNRGCPCQSHTLLCHGLFGFRHKKYLVEVREGHVHGKVRVRAAADLLFI